MIAERANVNYGLIHQYFGTKVQIFRAVFLDVSERVTAAARISDQGWWNRPDLFPRAELWRIVADLLLIGTVLQMGWEFPLQTIATHMRRNIRTGTTKGPGAYRRYRLDIARMGAT